MSLFDNCAGPGVDGAVGASLPLACSASSAASLRLSSSTRLMCSATGKLRREEAVDMLIEMKYVWGADGGTLPVHQLDGRHHEVPVWAQTMSKDGREAEA